MSKHQGKGVKQVMKGFLSGARKMVHPHEDETLFAETHRGRELEPAETSGARGTTYYIYVTFVTNGFCIL
jgi:hypothetical protein